MSDRQSYANTTAIHQSREFGLNFGHAVWRSAFLAITDSLTGESEAIGLTAKLKGPVRDGRERWSLVFPRITVDCLYDPSTALIVGLIPPASQQGERVPTLPKPAPAASLSPTV